MSLITPQEYRESLNDGRVVYYKGEKVENVATHPDLSVCVDLAAIDYEMAEDPEYRDMAVITDPETGEEIAATLQAGTAVGVDEISGGTPYGASHWAGPYNNNAIDACEADLCKALGNRVATLASRLVE